MAKSGFTYADSRGLEQVDALKGLNADVTSISQNRQLPTPKIMEFDPKNLVVRLCLQAMGAEEAGKPAEARELFVEAWNEAANDSEKFISAHYLARYQESVT